MSRLGKRVERLESGQPGDEVIVWMRFPKALPEMRRQEIAEATARERGYIPPFSFCLEDSRDTDDGAGIIFIGTDAEFATLLASIAREGRRIIDRG